MFGKLYILKYSVKRVYRDYYNKYDNYYVKGYNIVK